MLRVKPFHIRGFLPLPYEEALAPRLKRAQERLQSGAAPWVRLPGDRNRRARALADAAQIRRDSQLLVVVGSGAAALGARGILDYLQPAGGVRVCFIGPPTARAVQEALALAEGQEFSVASTGTDAESGAALRCFRAALEARYGPREAERRVYLPRAEDTAALPEERYALLTYPGLLPIAAGGADVEALVRGAYAMMERCAAGTYDCPAWQYAAVRYELYRTGRPVEMLVCRDPAMGSFLEWWRRIFSGGGERGLLPVTGFTGELCPAGRSPQADKPPMFETVLRPGPAESPLYVPQGDWGDGLDFLAGESLDYIQDRALEGALLAHTEGGVPNLVLETGGRTPEALGELIWFFQYARGLSDCLLDADPLGQSELEASRSNLSALLGQPGSAGRRAALEEKLRSGAALRAWPSGV